MAKFVVVHQAPESLRKDEHVIKMPDFLAEIRENANKAPHNGQTGVSHLRTIVGSIGSKYNPELTAWNIKPHLYEGRAFKSEQELSRIVVQMLLEQYPSIFDSYFNYQVKNRPFGTKLIYFTGPFKYTTAFFQNGIDQIEEKDIEVYLGLKSKKVVGKPAVTSEEAESLKNN